MSVHPSFSAASASQQYLARRIAAGVDDDVPSTPRAALVQPPDVEKAKNSPGQDQKDADEQVIPYNNMLLVFTGLAFTLFLAALDGTIVAIAMPTIVDDLGSGSGFSWIASSYLLATACVSPLCGKLSDIVGRKPVLITSTILFLVGSALCGAAQNIAWIIAARALQGLGGGGLMQSVMTIVCDITLLRDRSMYMAILTAINGASTVLGPLVGGALTQHISWRWCFWINLPTGGIAMIVLMLSLNLNPTKKRTFKEIASTFDFLGLILVTSGVILLLVGFQGAETAKNGWRAPQTIAPLASGFLMFVLGAINEIYTAREPIMPPRLFTTRTTACLLMGMLLRATTSMCASYYVPLYFQILGSSATLSGIRQLPLSFGSTLVSIFVGLLIKWKGRWRPILWTGYTIMTLGYGLMIMFEENTPTWKQETILLVTGLGIGCLYEPPYIGLQAAMPTKDIATTIGAASLIQLLGGAIGVSVGDTIFSTELTKRLARISGISSLGLSTNGGSTGFSGLSQIQPVSLRLEVLHAYTRSLATIWIFACPVAFIGLLCVLLVKEYSLDRPAKREEKDGKDASHTARETSAPIANLRSEPIPGQSHIDNAAGKAPLLPPKDTKRRHGTEINPVQAHESSSEYFDASDGIEARQERSGRGQHHQLRESIMRIRILRPITGLLQNILHFMRELMPYLTRHVSP